MSGEEGEQTKPKYGAVTFDTQVVVTNSFNFEGGLLNQLLSLRELPFDVVVSEVVVREIAKHLQTKTKEIRQKLESAFKTAKEYGIDGGQDLVNLDVRDVEAAARKRLLTYLENLQAEVVGPQEVSVKEVMKLYFKAAPPFSSGAKKSEFPDAIALLSLEAWALSGSKRILAISGDKDWLEYGKVSRTIDVVPEIADALEILNEQFDKARADAAAVLNEITSDPNSGLAMQLHHKLSSALEVMALHADASSPIEFESEIVDATLKTYELYNTDAFQLIAVNPDHTELVIRLDIDLFFSAETTFYFSVHDSVDDDYVNIGEAAAVTDDEATVKAIVTITTGEGGEREITNAEIVDRYLTIDFGYVEPDYGDEQDYYDVGGDPVSFDHNEKPEDDNLPF
ncbi:PIN domain-containing protein [Agrobacterium deltaense]|uniref:PIN domain-containing protein n=1 Tax=Agrobacterium deltaense TaxID=1183412 RepID=UPI001C6E03BE|nr:DUF4935 domain-containing protein [Agrobacterium deltaense]